MEIKYCPITNQWEVISMSDNHHKILQEKAKNLLPEFQIGTFQYYYPNYFPIGMLIKFANDNYLSCYIHQP